MSIFVWLLFLFICEGVDKGEIIMFNSIPQNVGAYPGVYQGPNPNTLYPVMYENHTNPEAEQFRAKVNSEIQLQQAKLRVEFLQNTLKDADNHVPNKEMTQVQRNVVFAELQDAQRNFALLKQQYRPDQLKMMGC